MKPISLAAAICCLSSLYAGAASSQDLLLSDGWSLYSSANPEQVYRASVPSTVMGSLTRNGLYKDILNATNYKTIDRTPFDSSWVYTRSFEMPALKKGQHAALKLDGLSFAADIWLNGKQIASRDTLYGPFRQWDIDITPWLKENNELKVEVFRAREGDPNIGFVDWNPRPADESMGIFRPVRVEVTGNVDIKDTGVHSKLDTENFSEADLTIQTTLVNKSNKAVKAVLNGEIDGVSFSLPVALKANETRTVNISPKDVPALNIKNPRVWWCRGLGNPEMYQLKLSADVNGKVSDSETVDFGIREIKDYFTPEGGRGFILNGKPVLVKSAGWTDDIFLRNTPESNEEEVRLVADMNLNSIRFENIWGTSPNIYDLCDKYGLMALVGWSCQWEWEPYMGVPEDEFGCIQSDRNMKLTARSLKDQVLWLRNHPAIIGWFVGSDMLPRPELEKMYLEFLPDIDDRPYLGSAKAMESTVTGPTGTKMAGPYEYVAPNYWYSKEAPGGAFGFNTETGIGAQLPVEESLRKFIPADRMWPVNETWDYHCTASSSAMNNLKVLNEVMENRYGKADSLPEYLRKADLINYEGTRAMFEAFRVNYPKSTAIVQWMLNSAWPSLYWQLYDYYHIPTAAYYGVKKGNRLQQLIYNYGDRAVYAVNESNAPVSLTASMDLYDLQGNPVSLSKQVTVEPSRPVKVFDVPEIEGNAFLFLSMTDPDGSKLAGNEYVLSSTQDEYAWDKSDWAGTPITEYADFKALDTIPAAPLKVSAVRNGDALKVTLANPNKSVAFFNRLALKTADGELAAPVFWDDNYVSLRPGETRVISCDLSKAGNLPGNLYLETSGWNSPKQTVTSL